MFFHSFLIIFSFLSHRFRLRRKTVEFLVFVEDFTLFSLFSYSFLTDLGSGGKRWNSFCFSKISLFSHSFLTDFGLPRKTVEFLVFCEKFMLFFTLCSLFSHRFRLRQKTVEFPVFSISSSCIFHSFLIICSLLSHRFRLRQKTVEFPVFSMSSSCFFTLFSLFSHSCLTDLGSGGKR